MYLKLRRFYSAASNQGSGGTVTLAVEKVKDALSKFDNLESSLKKIVNATNNSSSVKPADLINAEKVTITFDNGVEQKMLSNSPIKYSESSMISSLSYIVIDRVRKLCDDIVKADSLQLTTTDEDDSLLDPITSSSSSEDSSVGNNQYTVGDLVVPPVTDGDKDDVTSGDYIISDEVVSDNVSENDIDISNDSEHTIESIVVPPTTGEVENSVGASDYIISNKVNNDNISDSEIIVPDKGQYTIENIVTGIDSNGDKVTINPGNYDIVDTKKDSNGNITDICIMVNGEKIWVSLKDENVTSKEKDNINNKQYTIEDTVTIIDKNGNKITISPGDYEIVDTKKDSNGNITDICIIVNGEKIWVSLNDNVVNDVYVNNINKDHYTIEDTITGIDSNGNKVTINPGNYDIVDTKKDANGNITNICIIVNGDKIWVSLNDNVVNDVYVNNINKDHYTIEDTITGIDSNGNKVTINSGIYEIVDTKKDGNGNITDICIIVNGKKIWLTIINGNVVINNNLNIVNNHYNLDTTLTITSLNGNQIIIKPGSYEIVDIKKDVNGNITAICIAADGNYVWLVINNGQITNTLLQTLYDGMYVFNDVSLNIYDNNGNIIGTITNGRYNIYEVIVDNSGKITWIRISKDGEPKYWINVYFQETDWGIFVSYESEVKHDSGVLKLFDKNKGPLIGVLGILVVGLGAIMYARKTKKSKNVDNGTFAVYEVNENEDGEISDVRVSPDAYEDEYWIKF